MRAQRINRDSFFSLGKAKQSHISVVHQKLQTESKCALGKCFLMFLCQQEKQKLSPFLFLSSCFLILKRSVPAFNSAFLLPSLLSGLPFLQLRACESVHVEGLSSCVGFPFFHAVIDLATCSHTESQMQRRRSTTFPATCLLSTLRYAPRMRPCYFRTLEGGKNTPPRCYAIRRT